MNENYNITSAQYQRNEEDTANVSINATIDGIKVNVPMDTGNRHYQAILDWVAEGNSITDAS
jgi:hypothetical protein